MSRKIHCVCGEYLGEIRDATLKKGIQFYCSRCSSDSHANKLMLQAIEACDKYYQKKGSKYETH